MGIKWILKCVKNPQKAPQLSRLFDNFIISYFSTVKLVFQGLMYTSKLHDT